MTSVAQTCVLPTLEQLVDDLVERTPQQAGMVPLVGRQLAAATAAVAADVVATSLTFVGLEAFIISTALSGETLTELLLELQKDPQIQQRTQTRVRTETKRCIDPSLGESFGKGSRKVESVQDLWNRNGMDAMTSMAERTGSGAFTLTTPAQSSALTNWRRTMANLFNCVEILIESGIFCQGERGQRCRVPAIVERCILREIDNNPNGADDDG